MKMYLNSFTNHIICLTIILMCLPSALPAQGDHSDQKPNILFEQADPYAPNPDIPSVTSPDFEDALRKVVGAQPGRDWREFTDPEGRTVHNVTDEPYNAVMDGKTDDREALMLALQHAGAKDPPGIVYIPKGELRFTEAINYTSNQNGVALVGEGYETILIADTGEIDMSEPGGGRRAAGFHFDGNYFENVTIANLVLDMADNGHTGITSRNADGTGNRIFNVWVRNGPKKGWHSGITLTISGTHLKNITIRSVGGHGLGLNNGVINPDFYDDPEGHTKSLDPNPVRAEKIYVTDSCDPGFGGYAIDLSAGANIILDTFIAENNHNLGAKVPKTENTHIYNGLFKNNRSTELQTIDRWKHKVYLDNVKIDASGASSSEQKNAVRLVSGDWTIGTLLVEGAPNRNIWIDTDETGADVRAERIISRNSRGTGILLTNAKLEVEHLIAVGSAGCDLDVRNGANVYVKTLDVDQHCGNRNISRFDGLGTREDPYQVKTVRQLQDLGDAENLNKHFIQTADIDAGDTQTWNDSKGFTPIGNSTLDDAIPFTGSYDGAGFKISGLTIDRADEDIIGLFGDVGEGGRIKNSGLVNANVSGGARTGGLVGYNSGQVSNSYARAMVTGENQVGGLAGVNKENGEVATCYSSGKVSGSEDIGGAYWEQ